MYTVTMFTLLKHYTVFYQECGKVLTLTFSKNSMNKNLYFHTTVLKKLQIPTNGF